MTILDEFAEERQHVYTIYLQSLELKTQEERDQASVHLHITSEIGKLGL